MAQEYGSSSEDRARRRRSVLTLLIVVLIVFFAAWYAMSYVRADSDGTASSTTTTSSSSSSSTSSACQVDPEDVEVNVYNATDRTGLAAEVGRELEVRGFNVKVIANDPKQIPIPGAGQLRHGEAGAKGAELLAEHVGTGFADKPDERAREAVDVVLGERFDGLVMASKVAC